MTSTEPSELEVCLLIIFMAVFWGGRVVGAAGLLLALWRALV